MNIIGNAKNKSGFVIATAGEKADSSFASFVISIQEGDGEGLEPEDMEEGYVDYIDYTVFFLEEGNELDFKEWDGGWELLEQPYESLSVEEIISIMLHAVYGDDADNATAIIL